MIGIEGTHGEETQNTSTAADVHVPHLDKIVSLRFKGSKRKQDKIVVEWNKLDYSLLVKDKDKSSFCNTVYKEKKILQGISGRAETGQLLAIMGPTGCGKTSLLNILAGRCPGVNSEKVKLTGDITVNGEKRNEEKFRRISAYVLQDDHLYAHLTVAETFHLAASFFLPDHTSYNERCIIVDEVISELGLNKARDTIIGDEKTRGVSGGERKRASIGVQLISDPAILFLDEPTSGLDSFQAASVMESMKAMAECGRLVVSVIHQPRSSIYNMFDKLLLLTEGKCAYYGKSEFAVDYFSSLNYICPEAHNPADFFLDILSPDNRSHDAEIESRNRINYIVNYYDTEGCHKKWHHRSISSSSLSHTEKSMIKDNNSDIQNASIDYSHVNSNQDISSDIAINSMKSSTKYTQLVSIDQIESIGGNFTIQRRLNNFIMLSWRAWTEQRRDTFTIAIKFTFTIVFSLIIGGIYSHIGYGQRSVQNRFGLLFFIVLNQIFASVNAVFNTFPREKNIVNRERASKAYDTLSYYLAKVFVEIPLNVCPSIIYSCILYYMVELRYEGFGIFIVVLMYVNFVSITFGLMVSSGVNSSEAATAIGLPLMIINVLFGGFYIKVTSLPIVLNWIPYISMLRWAFQALCINEFTDLTFECDSSRLNECILTGRQALQTLAFDQHTVDYTMFGLSMCLLGFLGVGYTILLRSKPVYVDPGHIGNTIRKYLETSLNQGEEESLAHIYEDRHIHHNHSARNNVSNNSSNSIYRSPAEDMKESEDRDRDRDCPASSSPPTHTQPSPDRHTMELTV